MPLTSPGNDDDTGENHQPTLRKNTAEPVEQTLKQNSLTDAAVWWAVAEVVLKSKSVLACARDLHCSWGVLNRAVLEKGADVLAADLRRLDGVEAIGVDGHVWRHTRTGGRYVTVIVDLTPRRHGRPA